LRFAEFLGVIMSNIQRCESWEFVRDEVNENLLTSSKSSIISPKVYRELRIGRQFRQKNTKPAQPAMKHEYRTTCPDNPSDELSTSWEYLPTLNVTANIPSKDDEKNAAGAAARKRAKSL
jgi:hypothetical protein